MTLSLDTAYRSFGGEVEASSTPTICRLPDSRRHQLSAIAPPRSLRHGLRSFSAKRRRTVSRDRLSCAVSLTSASASKVSGRGPPADASRRSPPAEPPPCRSACALRQDAPP